MILFHINFKLGNDTISKLVDTYKQEKYLSDIDKFYTNYYQKNDEDFILKDFYVNKLKLALKHIGLEGRCEYDMDHWIHIYNNTTEGFGCHDHFTGTEFVSWVHFVKVPQQKCFHFIDSFANKQYPNNQNEGDFLVFPSWALHSADKVEDAGDRVIVSGNISINKYSTNTMLWDVDRQDYRIVWNHQPNDN